MSKETSGREGGGRDDTLSLKLPCALTECKLSEREREMGGEDKKKMRCGTFAVWQSWRDDCVQQTETDTWKKNGRWRITALKSSSSYRLELSGRARLNITISTSWCWMMAWWMWVGQGAETLQCQVRNSFIKVLLIRESLQLSHFHPIIQNQVLQVFCFDQLGWI